MARVEEIKLVDDLDGSEGAETVEFAVSGKRLEIDLSESNAEKFRSVLAPFVSAARRVSGGRPKRGQWSGSSAADRAANKAVREWAKARGMKISDRGRIPADVLEAYHREAS